MSEDRKEVLRRAFIELRELKARVARYERQESEPVAVVGMACRFPCAPDTSSYWQLLRDGHDAVVEVPRDRWNLAELYEADPASPGRLYSRHAGLLEEVDRFDTTFFGITPREADSMDPQQRLLLEVAWEALENAGLAPDRLAGSSTGVFLGLCGFDYAQLMLSHGRERIDGYMGSGSSHSVAAGRLSFFLGLRGPSLAVDTACSSSLVSLHLACRSLRGGECDVALAAGVNLLLIPETSIIFCKARMMSVSGRCRTFASGADGYVRGEGCGVVVLKRLSDAERDGDRILGVVRGTAVNHDGRSSGLTAPSGPAQEAVIRAALSDAGVAPSAVGYVEAHGTGTELGDPIEMGALGSVFCRERAASQPLVVGSVKTNIGHLEGAAGVAGLIKVLLCLEHGEIPAHLHFEEPSPHIDWHGLAVEVPTRRRAWTPIDGRRIAGVSSFGFSGTNAHVVVEEAPRRESEPRGGPGRRHRILSLSAKTERALRELVGRHAEYLSGAGEESWGEVCFTANTGRSQFPHRLSVVSDSAAEACARLQSYAAGRACEGLVAGEAVSGRRPKVAFLFTGQGSQYAGMGRELYESSALFRSQVDRSDALLAEHAGGRRLLEVLYGGESSLLDRTVWTQTSLYALEHALVELWRSWGIEPSYVLGHSLGEYSAASAAGLFSFEDGLSLVGQRARLMEALPAGGGMLSLWADEEEARARIAPYGDLSVAAVNAPGSTVVSGGAESIAGLRIELEREGVRCVELQVSHAFHSARMEPMLGSLEDAVSGVSFGRLRVPLVSNRTGSVVNAEDLSRPGYWSEHTRHAVRFAEGLASLRAAGCELFLEIGPHPVLTSLAQSTLTGGERLLASLRRGRSDMQQMLESLSQLYAAGCAVDWTGVEAGPRRRKLALPTYPFQRERFWIERGEAPPARESVELCEVAWRRAPRSPERPAGTGHCVILEDRGGVGQALAGALADRGWSSTVLAAGPNGINASDPVAVRDACLRAVEQAPAPCRAVVHLWSLDVPPTDQLSPGGWMEAVQLSCGSALHALQAVDQLDGLGQARLWLVTRGAQPAGEALPGCASIQAPVWGLGRVAALELADRWGGLIDLDPVPSEDEAHALAHEVVAPDGEQQVALRDGQRLVARLVKLEAAAGPAPAVRDDRTYLVTGGLGGIGIEIARWLVDRGARHLALVSRRGRTAESEERIAALTAGGARVEVLKADVSNAEATAGMLARVREAMPPIAGVFHLASVIEDGALRHQTWEQFERVLAPKALGGWNLHRALDEEPLDIFVFFSSVAAVVGSPGQANYAAANVFLDALAHERQARGLPGCAVDWGLWGEAGIAVGDAGTPPQRWRAALLEPLSTDDALAALERILAHARPQAAVLQADASKLLAGTSSAGLPRFLAELAPAGRSGTSSDEEGRGFAAYHAAPSEERVALLESELERRIRHILAAREPLPVERSLMELGLDSLMVMELLRDVSRSFSIQVYPRELYADPTIRGFAAHLASELRRTSAPSCATTGPALEPGTDRDRTVVIPRGRAQTRPAERLASAAFLLSAPRSGSTLLRAMLAGHPDLFCPPELHLLLFETMDERRAGLEQSFLGEGLQRAAMELWGLDVDDSAALLERWSEERWPIIRVYRELQRSAAPRLLVDKSPSYAGRRDALMRAETLFEGARYVHLVRHPCAAIESFVRNRMAGALGVREGDPHLLAERLWAASCRNVLELIEQVGPERHHALRFEDLVRDPVRALEPLCDFLGVPFCAEVLDPYGPGRMTDGVRPHSLPIGDPRFLEHQGIEPSLADAWRKVELPRLLEAETRALAAKLGFELPRDAAAAPWAVSASTAEPDVRDEDVRGLSLRIRSWTPPARSWKRTALCLHGILEHGGGWESVALELARRGFRVVAPDQRGHGRSQHVGPAVGYYLMDFVADATEMVRRLGERVVLVGHSMGAAVAAMVAAARPEPIESLVLVECPLPLPRSSPRETLVSHLDQLISAGAHDVLPDIRAAADRLRQATPALSEAAATRMATDLTEPCRGGVRWRWDARLRGRAGLGFDGGGAIDREHYLEILAGIDVPTSLVFGTQSGFASEAARDALRSALRPVATVMLAGGHNLHADAPEDLAAAIAASPEPVAESPR